MKPTVHVSNDFKTLRRQLSQELLFSDSPPFQKKIVLLPDLKTKNELMLAFLEEADVVLGLDFMELGAGLQFLTKFLTGKTLNLPPLDLLTLHILPLIEETYTEKKAQSLAAALAMEFLRYGKFGAAELSEWKTQTGWQQNLWKALFSKWDVPSQLLDLEFQKPDEPLEIHLYKFSFLPEIYHKFFEKVATVCPVHYYHFSPCATFWTDIFSEKERFHLEKKVDANVREEWRSYLTDRPLLLAHLGALSRQTFRFFEEADFPLDEHYTSPEKTTLLKQIQHQILHYEEKKAFKKDRSLLLHPAVSKRREVEILYTTLLSLDCKPSDIRVYAPDISAYAPFISLVFGAKDSPFAFSISDLPKEQESSLLQAFMQLLSLTRERFAREAVLRLFDCLALQRKFRLKDVDAFKTWMEIGGVKWGVDRSHRQTLLSGKEMIEQTEAGTWEDTFGAILVSFTKLPKDRPLWEKPLLDFSDAEAFGKCVSIVRMLKEDLTFLETAALSLDKWSQYLRDLLSRYFEVDEGELSTFKWMEEKFALLESDLLPKHLYGFHPIFEYLKSVFQEKTGKKEASQVESLRFSSLKLGAPDHAPIICLLGLDENQFPRVTTGNSLRELELKKQPLAQQEDRHLFLETLFSASEHLILSYVSINEEDGKEQAPSPIIQELMTFLEPITITETHPPFLFHEHYFKKSKPVSKLAFLAAKKYYSPEAGPAPLIPEFLTKSDFPPSQTEDLSVDLRDLSRFAKNPLRFYLNQTLHLYLQYEGKDEEFSLSPLNQSLLQKHAYSTTFDEAFNEADLHGKLPLGRFKEVARHKASEEIQMLKQFEKPFPLDLSLEIALGSGRLAKIEGTLLDVTSEGLLFHGEKKLPDLLKVWPLYLAYACQAENKDLILTKTDNRLTVSDPEKALAAYLLYYEKAQFVPSPFFPKWASAFLEKGPSELAKKIDTEKDPYARWIFKPHTYDPVAVFDTWAPLLQTTFKPLQEALS